MTKSILLTLAVVSLTPAPVQGATVISPTEHEDAATDGFSVSVLIDGADHVLASVDATPPPLTYAFDVAAAFATRDVAARPAGPAIRSGPVYGGAEAAREPLPETATWLMMILGFFGLSFAVRRRSIATGDRVRFS